MIDERNPYAPPPGSESLQPVPEPWLSNRVWRDGDLLVVGRGAELRPRCFVTGVDTDYSTVIRTYWQPRWVYLLILMWGIPYLLIAPFYRRYLHLKIPVDRDLLVNRQRQSRRGRFMAGYATLALAILLPNFEVAGIWFLPVLCGLSLILVIGIAFARAPLVGLQIERIDDQTLVLRNLPKRCLEGLLPWPQDKNLDDG